MFRKKIIMFMMATLMMTTLILPFGITRADGPVTIGVNGSGPLSRNANLSWIRSGDYWANINPAYGQWNFSHADLVVSEAESQGQEVLFILSGAPAWCGGGPRGNTPCAIEFWKTYVDQVTRHFQGRVAAYEIWNEPDLINQSAFGVGWDWWDINTYPHRYIDYFVEAARIIKTNDPSALVVGPAMSGSTTRAVTIWQQFENTYFPDGNASDFLDVVSVHHNGQESQHSEDIARKIRERMQLIARWNPRNARKPVWITEFGWNAKDISENSQRIRIKNLLIEMGGGGYGYLRGYNIPKAFIYVLRTCDGDEGKGIYRCSGFPRPVVSQYLQTLPFPATQDPSVPRE
ncbi:MAG: endo-1,4-beta-xylanase [Acidobacteriota bacterium]